MLRLVEITKRFRKADFTLDKISFCLDKGIHMLVGPNGSGKSTLLRMIATILRPDTGEILYNGRDLYGDLPGYKLELGYLPQNLGFYGHMTGIQFLCYIAGLKGISHRLGRERADFVIELLGIQNHCDKKIFTWSVGQRQRLGLAQALINDPAILILDEPFCGLDLEETDNVKQLLARLSRKKLVFFSSHIIEDWAIDGLVLLVNGKLQFAGLPASFVNEARGQVWSVETAKNEWLKVQHKYSASTVIFEEGCCRCKIINDCRPGIPGAKAIAPGLEDAYIFWLKRNKQDREGNSLC